jgi:hypothetical protein
VGQDNVERVRLRSGPGNNAGVALWDTNDQPRVAMGIVDGPDGAMEQGFTLRAANGTSIMRLGTVSQGLSAPLRRSGNLILRDDQDRDHIRLLVADDGTPSIELLDRSGTLIWSAP